MDILRLLRYMADRETDLRDLVTDADVRTLRSGLQQLGLQECVRQGIEAEPDLVRFLLASDSQRSRTQRWQKPGMQLWLTYLALTRVQQALALLSALHAAQPQIEDEYEPERTIVPLARAFRAVRAAPVSPWPYDPPGPFDTEH